MCNPGYIELVSGIRFCYNKNIMNIPVYPAFADIDKEHKSVFDALFKADPPLISEYTFTNLYAWRGIYGLKVSFLNDMLLIRSDEMTPLRFFNPLGSGAVKPVIERVLNDSKGFFIRIPESTLSFLNHDERFKIEEDRVNADYLYNSRDLIELAGKKYDGKRNLIKKFRSGHAYKYIVLDALNAEHILEFEERWCIIRDCDNIKGLNDERCAIREMVRNFGAFGLTGGAIEVDDEICAVAIAEALNPDTLVVHVLKADTQVPGLYQLMGNEFFSREAKRFAYINLEQDLGIEGLRKAKLSYHPVALVKKFIISV